MPNYQNKRIDPQDGMNVVLTIDETIQYIATGAELSMTIRANGGVVIVFRSERRISHWYRRYNLNDQGMSTGS